MSSVNVREPAVESDEEIERLLLPHLADDDAIRSHPERFLHESAQHDLAGALEVCLPSLHRDHVGNSELELEDLLASDDPLTRRDRAGEAVEQRRLPRLSPARHDDVEPCDHGGLEEPRGWRRDGLQTDQLIEAVGRQHELADVD
jgi:hypothetical protein